MSDRVCDQAGCVNEGTNLVTGVVDVPAFGAVPFEAWLCDECIAKPTDAQGDES